jgi:uncharacterized membrane protein
MVGRGQKKAAESAAFWSARRDEIERLYCGEGQSLAVVAVSVGVCTAALSRALKRLGIQARSRGTSGQNNGRFKDGRQFRVYRDRVVKERCATCGAEPPAVLDIHHVNGDHFDNRPENLQVLCRSCHMRETVSERWRKRRAGLPTAGNAPVGWRDRPRPRAHSALEAG